MAERGIVLLKVQHFAGEVQQEIGIAGLPAHRTNDVKPASGASIA